MTTDAQRRHETHELHERLMAMGFNNLFEPRTPEGYATEMLRVMRIQGAYRARMVAGAGNILEASKRASRLQESGRQDMFAQAEDIPMPTAKPWTPMEMIGHEAGAMGWEVTAHPLYRPLRNAMALLGVDE